MKIVSFTLFHCIYEFILLRFNKRNYSIHETVVLILIFCDDVQILVEVYCRY